VLPLLDAYASALLSDKGGPEMITAGERAMVELATLARGCVLLVLAQAAAGGGIVGSRRGVTVRGAGATRSLADADLAAALARFMAVETSALKAIGLERRARPVLTPEAYWSQRQAARAAQATEPAAVSAREETS